MTYTEQLKSPKWQKKRLLILERDKFTCQICSDTEENLQVHHKKYISGRAPWDYEDSNFTTLCETCHKELSIFIKQNKTEVGFDLLKLYHKNINKKTVITLTNGNMTIFQDDRWVALGELHLKKLVHFIINNWLKNE